MAPVDINKEFCIENKVAQQSTSPRLILLWFVLSDLIGMTLGVCAAYFMRFGTGVIELSGNYTPKHYVELFAIAVPVWLFWLARGKCYDFLGRAFNRNIMRNITRACFKATLTFVVVHFFTRNLEFSRYVYLFAFLGSVFCIGVMRFITDRLLGFLRHRGIVIPPKVAIIGLHDLGVDLVASVESHAYLNLSIEGFIRLNNDAATEKSFAGKVVLGSIADLPAIAAFYGLSEVIVNAPELSADELLDLVYEGEKNLLTVRIAPNLLQDRLINLEVEQVDSIPLFGLKETPLNGRSYIAKRVFDFFASTVLLLLCAVPMAIIALLICFNSRGGAIYSQKRVSLDGREFDIYKFRTMRINDDLTPTRPNDSRITGIGRFLRATSIDELPQLWNVFIGDMSLVGPRPERPHLVNELRDRVPRYMSRLRVPAGMTGLAQINGLRQGTSLERRVSYDLYYIENWSFWLDIKILLLTVVSFRRNAY